MDSLASLALATELPKAELLQRPPYRKREYIISQKMVKHILGQAIYQSIILFVFVFAGHLFIPDGREGPMNVTNDLSVGITASGWANYLKKYPDSAYKDWDGGLVFNGMAKGFKGEPIYNPLEEFTSSRHLTVVFNLFVLF